MLLTCPELFARTDLHEAGRVILAFKALGWSDRAVAARLVPRYPKLLAGKVALDVAPVVEALARAGCTGSHLRLIAWEVPRVFSRHTFRRYLRQFAALGVYGLSLRPPAAAAAPSAEGHADGGGVDGGESGGGGGAASAVGTERAVRATMLLHPFG